LPGSFDTSCRGTEAYLPLIYEGGILALKEFRALGFRPLFAIVLPPYQIFARHQIATLKSFEGWKIQTAGGAKELMIRKMNAVPIRMAAPEIYEALSRGTIDGGTLATGSILSYNLLGPAKAVTIGENFGSIVAIWGMSEARWSKLPERLRRIMIEAGNHASRNMCRLADEGVQADYRKMKEHGLTVVALPPEDRKEINSLAAAVRNEWKQALEERGKAASEVLRDFSERVAAQR
jgi:TRAP-type C4-dicarboxylate transport system substrate-binding protein